MIQSIKNRLLKLETKYFKLCYKKHSCWQLFLNLNFKVCKLAIQKPSKLYVYTIKLYTSVWVNTLIKHRSMRWWVKNTTKDNAIIDDEQNLILRHQLVIQLLNGNLLSSKNTHTDQIQQYTMWNTINSKPRALKISPRYNYLSLSRLLLDRGGPLSKAFSRFVEGLSFYCFSRIEANVREGNANFWERAC